uniref:Na(+)/H(+) exchange regulatory cofactor NHE-RF3-like n=1 Tax=Myxine glutinosa TaxID=7769 RepID=UPI00358E3A82
MSTHRVCHVSATPSEGLGFCVHMERSKRGHLVRTVEPGGAGERAGLRDGDHLIAVDGVSMEMQSHEEVVARIMSSGRNVTLTVQDVHSYPARLNERIEDSLGLEKVIPPLPRYASPMAPGQDAEQDSLGPRLCYLKKVGNTYGFVLKSVESVQGLFVTKVADGGAARQAGIREGDRIVHLDGDSVEGLAHMDVVRKIELSGSAISLLVVDNNTATEFHRRGCPVEVRHAKVMGDPPYGPRSCFLVRGKNGFGFHLRLEKERPGHYIREIEPESSAEKAGLQDGDRLLVVSGVATEALTHDEVVSLICAEGGQVSFTLLDPDSDKWYTKVGLCPQSANELKASRNAVNSHRLDKISAPPLEPPPSPPRLCKLSQGPDGFGFHLNGIRGLPGQYIKKVVQGSPAALAGMQNDDHVIEVEGTNVENSPHEKVVQIIQGAGNNISLLLSSQRSYRLHAEMQISAANAENSYKEVMLNAEPLSKPAVESIGKSGKVLESIVEAVESSDGEISAGVAVALAMVEMKDEVGEDQNDHHRRPDVQDQREMASPSSDDDEISTL